MKEVVNVAPQKLAHLHQCPWQNVTEPGAYVEVGTGDLYRFPHEALIQGSSPVIRRETLETPILVQLSREPIEIVNGGGLFVGRDECPIRIPVGRDDQNTAWPRH